MEKPKKTEGDTKETNPAKRGNQDGEKEQRSFKGYLDLLKGCLDESKN